MDGQLRFNNSKIFKYKNPTDFKNLSGSFFFHNLVISTKEKSPQVTPQRKTNLCRASSEDFSFVEMTKITQSFANFTFL